MKKYRSWIQIDIDAEGEDKAENEYWRLLDGLDWEFIEHPYELEEDE